MVSFTSLLAAVSIVTVAFAAPSQEKAIKLLQDRQQRFTIQNWENDYADVNFTNGAGGNYAIKWNNGFGGDFVIGKGYSYSSSTGFPKINYSGTWNYNPGANAYLALYGWTTNPLAEFYVIENMGVHNPSDNASATKYGIVESDGATYELWTKIRTNAPSILGDSDTYPQYWSVRTKGHVGGTINMDNHWRAWKAIGWALGNPTGFSLVTEGQYGGGSCNITLGVAPTTFPVETSTSTRRTEPNHYSTHALTTIRSSWFSQPTGSTSRPPTTSARPTSTSIRPTTSARPTSTLRTSTVTTSIRTTPTSTRRPSSSSSRLSTSTKTVTFTSVVQPPTTTRPSQSTRTSRITLTITIGSPP